MNGNALQTPQTRPRGTRPSVEVLVASSVIGCRSALETDFALLDRVEEDGAPAAVRVWTCSAATVVIGVGQDPAREVDLEHCRCRGTGVLRRASGGGAVVIGPGTVQYAFALPYALSPSLSDIGASKLLCNSMLTNALARCGIGAGLHADHGGDLRIGDRKAGGLALRRRRRAMLLHGTILAQADIEELARTLRHPSREPGYRSGRAHEDFLVNLGAIDEAQLEAELAASLQRLR